MKPLLQLYGEMRELKNLNDKIIEAQAIYIAQLEKENEELVYKVNLFLQEMNKPRVTPSVERNEVNLWLN